MELLTWDGSQATNAGSRGDCTNSRERALLGAEHTENTGSSTSPCATNDLEAGRALRGGLLHDLTALTDGLLVCLSFILPFLSTRKLTATVSQVVNIEDKFPGISEGLVQDSRMGTQRQAQQNGQESQ